MALPENPINNLIDWFDVSITWLHADGSLIALQPPHQQLVEQMESEVQSQRAWGYIEELEELTQTADTRERGETIARCARRTLQLGSLKDALRLCNEAKDKYTSFNHQHAVSLWMIGSIHWNMRQDVKAIANWRLAIYYFKLQRDNLTIGSKNREWYSNTIRLLENCLAQAIRDEALPICRDFFSSAGGGTNPSRGDPNPFGNGPIPGQTPPGSQSNTTDPLDSLKWTTIPINDTVPAGGFGAVGYEPPKEFLEVTEVRIGNDPFSVHSVKGKSLWRNSIALNPSADYQIMLVSGTSMNNSRPVRIENGDFVLVRRQNEAADNEIVVAAIRDIDILATIKRLKKITSTIIQLIPETFDEKHYQNPSFGKELDRSEVNIVGVVEAVFKKKAG